ncbi:MULTISPECIES: polysaccharide biosynthesis tyrosine autokinase [Enterobacter]|uniref:polysaccharide biosynthesis tyrosine autokinase n=1 Tax=Enterobacter TaxID=547 RepID=UPI0007AD9ADA|nr:MULTISPECIES: polysaccharide biosynthesis tyrosine autokinase [Enterobacter]AMZ77779.1 protein-tyrosine kinase [Enterobacter sp. ODB01]EKS6337612.1 polysaccharide biosynthesis tyrosine autokinase [Enterobacter hormaechei]VAL43354.1 Tyrosine-protein kinase Wzc [Enterobacter kobei]
MILKNNATGTTESREQDIDLMQLARLLAGRFPLILGVTAAVVLVATALVISRPPVWQADALVQVEQHQGSDLLGNLSQFLPDARPDASPEIELLRSRMVLGKTIDDLNLQTVVSQRYFPVLGRLRARLTGEPPATLSVATLTLPAVNGRADPVMLIAGRAGHFTLEGEQGRVQGQVGQRLEQGGISLLVTGLEAPPGTRFTLMHLTKPEALKALEDAFTVTEKGKSSGMLSLMLRGDDPAQTARILDRIAGNYLEQNIDRQAARDGRQLAYLQEQLPRVRESLDGAESRLNAYRREQDSVDLSLEAKSVLEQTVNVDNQLNALTFREAEIAQLYKKNHPVFRALLEKRQTLLQEKKRLAKQVSGMPATQQEILRLSREVESGRAIYLQLLHRQQELSISRSSVTGNVRIIDPALTASEPLGPQTALVVLLAALGGATAGCALVVVLNVLRRNVESPEELEALGIEVCATVPVSAWMMNNGARRWQNRLAGGGSRAKQGPPFLAAEHPEDVALEAVRALRTRLHFALQAAPENKVVMLTSPTPGCGKTFVSTLLAAVMAQTSRRILLLDADMRLSYLAQMLGLENRSGLSSLLKGEGGPAAVVQHAGAGGFDVITSGPFTDSPSELLMSAGFGELLGWAREHYDMVIIDTPPVLAVTDPVIIGHAAGISLLVARAGHSNAREILLARQILVNSGRPPDAVILNGVAKQHGTYYGYYQGYGKS